VPDFDKSLLKRSACSNIHDTDIENELNAFLVFTDILA
jgi:hypothetical protein